MKQDQLTNGASAKEPAEQSGETDVQNSSGEVWIYGFGSLVYRPGFDYQQKVFGYIRGWRRVFWQGSTDHRGVPGAPGQVATIVEAGPESKVWGAAFHLAGTPEEQQKTLKYLEHREKQFDVRQQVDVLVREDATERVAVPNALVFIASDSSKNENWLGPAEPEAIAKQIAHAVGPSGANCEYVYKLAEAMHELGVVDEELDWLADRVMSIRGRPAGMDGGSNAPSAPDRLQPDLLDD